MLLGAIQFGCGETGTYWKSPISLKYDKNDANSIWKRQLKCEEINLLFLLQFDSLLLAA